MMLITPCQSFWFIYVCVKWNGEIQEVRQTTITSLSNTGNEHLSWVGYLVAFQEIKPRTDVFLKLPVMLTQDQKLAFMTFKSLYPQKFYDQDVFVLYVIS